MPKVILTQQGKEGWVGITPREQLVQCPDGWFQGRHAALGHSTNLDVTSGSSGLMLGYTDTVVIL